MWNPSNGTMELVAFMSGKGSNLIKIIEHERKLKNERGKFIYKVVAIFSDNFKSSAPLIGSNFDIPVICRDIRSYYRYRNKPLNDMEVRKDFDRETAKCLSPYFVKFAAFCGYMSIISNVLVYKYIGINVHPADLSIIENGKRKYIGIKSLENSIMNKEKFIRSTTHLVEEEVDNGRILMKSPPIEVHYNKTLSINYYRHILKVHGDWVIFPKTLQYIAEGRYRSDVEGQMLFDNNSIPYGLDNIGMIKNK